MEVSMDGNGDDLRPDDRQKIHRGIMDHRSSFMDHTLAHYVLFFSHHHHRHPRCSSLPGWKKKKWNTSNVPSSKNAKSHAALILIFFQALDPTNGFCSIALSIWATLGDNKLYDTGRLEKLNSETSLAPKCDFVIAYEERILTFWALLICPLFN